MLTNDAAARSVRRRWLKTREVALGEGDVPGRLHLARLYFQWLEDREAAARLAQEALHLDPGSKAAASLLQDELQFQLTDKGWTPRPQADKGAPAVTVGMTAAEVRNLRGKPKQIARQIIYQRVIEQWVYDAPSPLIIQFECVKGREPRVLSVQAPRAKP
jgi:hypothetical protein